ncbi:MAG: hypothetical protein PHW77_06370 [Eubacteriales bacterium]|nr:hypothetical protein [Eubacteriales bacterium]
MNDITCVKCGAPLTCDDMGAHKKLINRGAKEFMCIPCLAVYFQVSEELVRQKVEEFKKAGCMLFTE